MLFWIPGLYNFFDEAVALRVISILHTLFKIFKYFFKTVVGIQNLAKKPYISLHPIQCTNAEQAYC